MKEALQYLISVHPGGPSDGALLGVTMAGILVLGIFAAYNVRTCGRLLA